MTRRIFFGHIPGYPEGSQFDSRAQLSQAGVHKPPQAGISGKSREGADSIVLSGGYEDDKDFGDEIVYTGQGGRDSKTGHQISHQLLIRGNLALAKSCLDGLPVRVIRGATHKSQYSPDFGYRYDGLYMVDDYWRDTGKSGFHVWRFRLTKIAEHAPAGRGIAETPEDYAASPREEVIILRIVRDTEHTRRIKALYDYRCQMCGIRLEGLGGPYAEAAHIRPLGKPHNGPDKLNNILCLCPNHHVLFDHGGVAIADDFSLIGEPGRLTIHPDHQISLDHIRYHRNHYPVTEV